MRISCSFKADIIPIAYRMMFVSLIKESLKSSDLEYFEKIYKYKEQKNKQSKNFCFSVFMKDFEMNQDKFKIKGEVLFNISSPEEEFIINLYNGLLKQKVFQYKDFKLEKNKITLLKEKKINDEEIVLKTLSPVFMKNKNNEAIDPFSKDYAKELNYILHKELENYRGYGQTKEIEFIPVRMKKQVIKEEIRDFKVATDKKYIYLNSYSGVFKLKGNIGDLRDIYRLGIGFRRNQGFGMVEVV